MDKNVDPCEDFYSFACGGFEAKMAIPDHQSKVDTFSLNSDRVTQQLRFLIEKSIEENDVYGPFGLVTKLYQSCLDKSESISYQSKMESKLNILCTQLA